MQEKLENNYSLKQIIYLSKRQLSTSFWFQKRDKRSIQNVSMYVITFDSLFKV